MMNKYTILGFLFFLILGTHTCDAQFSYGGKVELGHVFNDLYFSGTSATGSDGSKWSRRSFLFSPIAGVHGKVRYKTVLLTLGCQFQKSGRYYKEETRYNSSGVSQPKMVSHSQKFLFNKIGFPLAIGLTNKRKKASESIFIGIRPCLYSKAVYTAIKEFEYANATYKDTLSLNLLKDAQLGRTIPKLDYQGFLGLSFPESGPLSVSLIIYMGNIYSFDKLQYIFQEGQSQYVNFDGVLSIRYNFDSK